MTLDEYAKHVARRQPVVDVDGMPWRMARGILEPLAMPHTMRPVDRAKVRQAMRTTGARIARWNDAWDTPPCEWWWICCDDAAYDLESFPRKRRQNVRAALRRTEVRRVDVEWLAQRAYDVCVAAFQRYGPAALPPTRERFVEGTMAAGEYPGYEVWAGFAEGQLVAYMTCYVLQDAVQISSNKWDPQFRRHMPNDALQYVLTRHYIVERHLAYVTTGSRVVYHDTKTQDFDLTLGYRRVFCPLRAEFDMMAKGLVTLGLHRVAGCMGINKLVPGPVNRLCAAVELARIARSCGDRCAPAVR
jgi:hypothetical protein